MNNDDYDEIETDLDVNLDLAEMCVKITEWWLEDYTFEELLEEFDVLPEEAFYAVVKAGLIDEEDLKNYLSADG
jgi:hypothetical protein